MPSMYDLLSMDPSQVTASAPPAADVPSPPPQPSQAAPQGNWNVPPALLSNQAYNSPPGQAVGPSAGADDPSQDVMVTAHKLTPPGAANAAPPMPDDIPPALNPPPSPPRPPGAYDNTNQVQDLNSVRAKYPSIDDQSGATRGSGLGLANMLPNSKPGAGTLRNMLGTLGDAFLISSGHQPTHAQQNYNRQIADASAGMDTDPMGAASRIAATGAPGSMDIADKIEQQARQAAQTQATQANTMAYRQGVLGDRTQNHQAIQQIALDKQDERIRSLNGGILTAAASTNDPAKYAAARAAAIARIPKGSSITADEYPTSLGDYNSGYGRTGQQVTRGAEADASLAQRTSAAQGNLAARYAGIRAGVQNNSSRVAATERGQDTSMAGQVDAIRSKVNAGQSLTAGDQAVWNHATHIGGNTGPKVTIPGVSGPSTGIGSNLPPPHPNGNLTTIKPAAQAPKFQENHVYQDAHGNKAKWSNGRWVNP